MCTVLYLQELNLLSKNRDKDTSEAEEIVQTPDLLAVRTKGADYYSLAINKNGCAFVSTAINSQTWTRAVEEGRTEDAKKLWASDTKGRNSPTHIISLHISEARKIEDLIDLVRNSKSFLRGYNIILADQNGAVVLETFGKETNLRHLNKRDVVTNHFKVLPHGPQKLEDYPNSFERFDYATEKVPFINSLDSLYSVVRPADLCDKSRIWRKGAFQTISSTVLDLTELALYYSNDLDVPHEQFSLL